MPGKYYQQHPERSGFADAGLMIAFTVIVVTGMKLLLYGITIVSLAWLAISLVYMAVAAASRPRSAIRTGFTAFYMLLSVGAIYASFYYDNPIQEKRESNLRADQDDTQTQDKNRQVKVETPKPVAVETDVVSEDESKFEEVSTTVQTEDYSTSPADDEDDEEIELVDLSSGQDTEGNNQTEEIQENPVEEQNTEQFDTSYE